MATSDADRSVRVATIGLLDNVRQRDLLEPEDIDKISLMIFDPESRIRRAVVRTFLSNVEEMYEETCERVGGSIEEVESELGNDKDTTDGVPFTWLKYNALVKALGRFDQMVDELQQGDKADNAKLPYKGFELGDMENRISQAASAILTEMDELNVAPSLMFANSRIGTALPHICCEITLHDLMSEEEMQTVFSQRHEKVARWMHLKRLCSLKS
jgi:hypothetical protein